jgi:Mg2+/Co2+ transporter CorB
MEPAGEAPSLLAVWGVAAAILALVGLAALFAGAEAALTAASRPRLHGLAEKGDRGAAEALRLTDDRERLTGAMLLGGDLAKITAAALAAGFFGALVGAGAAAAATMAVAALVLVLAELTPRLWAAADPERAAGRLARPVTPVVALAAPVVAMAAGLARRALGLFGVRAEPQAPASGAEAPGAMALHPFEGPAESEQRDRLLGALDLGDRQVEEVMMHRRDIEMIDADADPAEILAQAINSPHTRIPIFRGEPENIVGVIHAKDLSRAVHRFVREAQGGDAALEGFDIMAVAMEPYFVPESTPLDEQLREFLRRRAHFALVVDEYGALQGLITLEDIIEEIVGDIADEHDVEVSGGIEPLPDGSVEVEGVVTIRDLNRACGWNLPDDEANTVAGLVIHEAQAIPTEGQAFSFHGFRFEVVERQANRLTRLRLRKLV